MFLALYSILGAVELQQWYQSVEKHEIGLGLNIWVNLILSMINEIGWISMLKYVYIEDWLDQFEEIMTGSFFPNNLSLAELYIVLIVLVYLIFDALDVLEIILEWI